MKRFALTIAALALMASTSQACPLFGRRTSCSSSTKVTYVQCPPSPEVVVVDHKESKAEPNPVPVAAPSSVPTCPNGNCSNQALQVGPSRGFFFKRTR